MGSGRREYARNGHDALKGLFPVCPICRGSAQPAFIAGVHRMYICDQCRTAFCWPQPTDAELNDFYFQFHAAAEQNGWYDEVESRMQADFPTKLGLVKRVTGGSPGRILDVGCGKGFFVRACVDAGLQAEGIDVSKSAVQYAREEVGITAHLGSIGHLKASLGKFNTVTLWATIEHLPRPEEALRDIASVLTPGGYLFADTGRGDDWLDRLLPGRVQWYDPPQHLFVFSEIGFRRLLKKAGFDVVQFDGCFERSGVRKAVRIARAAVIAGTLRAASAAARLRGGRFEFTRYPVGNLMNVCAQVAVPSETESSDESVS